VQQSVEKTAIFLTALGLGVLIEDDFMERETGASRDDGHNQLGFVPFFFTFTLSYLHLCTLNSFKYEYIQKTINLYRRRVN